MKIYLMADIVRKLQEAGILKSKTLNGGKQVVHYWIRGGLLKLKRNEKNHYYYVGEDEMKTVISNFLPTGPGYYHYDE